MKLSKHKKKFYPEATFGGFTRIDGTIAFYTRVNALLEPEFTVVDVGCGRGEYAEDACRYRRELRILKGKVQKVIGLDVDEAGHENPHIDEFRKIEDTKWPGDDGSADLIVCDNVIEHLPDPDAFFQECHRVLRPGGYVCVRTPNVISYFGLASRLIPSRKHADVLAQVQDGRKEEDVFPTLYRCNSKRKLRRTMQRWNFEVCVVGWEAEPSYLSFNVFAYWLGTLHARLAPEFLKLSLMGFAQKK